MHPIAAFAMSRAIDLRVGGRVVVHVRVSSVSARLLWGRLQPSWRSAPIISTRVYLSSEMLACKRLQEHLLHEGRH
eukprot:10219066-Heterocapsa_arctica.AAC.1